MNIKYLVRYGFYFVIVLFAVLLVYRQFQISQMPAAELSIPLQIDQQEIPVPKRPGTQSIRIVGPPIQVLKFQLDFKFYPKPLDWNFLERIDRRADVMILGVIDVEGNFTITAIRDKGHPKAGQYIKSVMESWRFVQYKQGIIKYYFNVPTKMEHMKVQIDLRGLKRNLKYVDRKDKLENGMIYHFEGIDRNNIMIIN
ncbi:MAG: hypothetical protein ACE5HS_06000 [bacterium]